jgi:hypothetical protein
MHKAHSVIVTKASTSMHGIEHLILYTEGRSKMSKGIGEILASMRGGNYLIIELSSDVVSTFEITYGRRDHEFKTVSIEKNELFGYRKNRGLEVLRLLEKLQGEIEGTP